MAANEEQGTTEVPPAAKQSGLLDQEDEVLTPDEAAGLLKLSTKTVLRHARRGELPGTKVGRVWRFRRSELLAFLTSGSA